MKLRKLGLASAVAGLATIAIGPATAAAHTEYYCDWSGCYAIAYSYIWYSDAEKTQPLGHGWDTCVQSGSTVYAAHPYIPTPYYDETPMYVCAEMGPYLPPDWPY
jgi:hypothetical protein